MRLLHGALVIEVRFFLDVSLVASEPTRTTLFANNVDLLSHTTRPTIVVNNIDLLSHTTRPTIVAD
jgi:hypothetical protein